MAGRVWCAACHVTCVAWMPGVGCACDAALQGGVHLAPQDFHKAMEKDNTVSASVCLDLPPYACLPARANTLSARANTLSARANTLSARANTLSARANTLSARAITREVLHHVAYCRSSSTCATCTRPTSATSTRARALHRAQALSWWTPRCGRARISRGGCR